MSYYATNFFFEISKGNIHNHATKPIISINPNADSTYKDLWGGSTNIVWPTSAETWEIVSSSENDSSTGSGIRTVFVFSLDINYVEQVTVVTMNGTNAVTVPGTHYRPDFIVAGTSGSSGCNEGAITLRDASTGNVRNVMPLGNSISTDSHYTVPAGKELYFAQILTYLPKDVDGHLRIRSRAHTADAPWITAGQLPYYQNAFSLSALIYPRFPEKTDINSQVKLSVGSGEVTQILECVLVTV